MFAWVKVLETASLALDKKARFTVGDWWLSDLNHHARILAFRKAQAWAAVCWTQTNNCQKTLFIGERVCGVMRPNKRYPGNCCKNVIASKYVSLFHCFSQYHIYSIAYSSNRTSTYNNADTEVSSPIARQHLEKNVAGVKPKDCCRWWKPKTFLGYYSLSSRQGDLMIFVNLFQWKSVLNRGPELDLRQITYKSYEICHTLVLISVSMPSPQRMLEHFRRASLVLCRDLLQQGFRAWMFQALQTSPIEADNAYMCTVTWNYNPTIPACWCAWATGRSADTRAVLSNGLSEVARSSLRKR